MLKFRHVSRIKLRPFKLLQSFHLLNLPKLATRTTKTMAQNGTWPPPQRVFEISMVRKYSLGLEIKGVLLKATLNTSLRKDT